MTNSPLDTNLINIQTGDRNYNITTCAVEDARLIIINFSLSKKNLYLKIISTSGNVVLNTSSGILGIRGRDKTSQEAVKLFSEKMVDYCKLYKARYVNLYINRSRRIWTNVVSSYFFEIGAFLDRCYVVSDEHFSVFKFKF